MSELTKTRPNTRMQLLASVSSLALIVGAADAHASGDHPTVWIEVGAQVERLSADQSPFVPDFVANYASSKVFNPSPLLSERLPQYGIGGEGKVSFEPRGSDWVFGVSARYGRSNSTRHMHKEEALSIPNPKYVQNPTAYPSPFVPYKLHNVSDALATNHENHLILDFQAGRDIGVGLFGRDGSSVLNFGVRVAQFTSDSSVDIEARPNIEFYSKYVPPPFVGANVPLPYFHDFRATAQTRRSFHGAGPSLSWEGSIPVAGNRDGGELTFDLGINAALLFGRQKMSITHRTTGYYFKQELGYYIPRHMTYQSPSMRISRSRPVTVPNLGGFAGVSMRFSNAKVSLGYRTDFFLGAMDFGSDARRSGEVGFHGPFATISIGLP